MGYEFELKFSATEQVLEEIMAAYPLEYQSMEMQTVYYDTADHGLSDRHITLRQRLENGQPVCTVKTPGVGVGRGEWECKCPDIHEGIYRLCELGAPKELLVLTAPGVEKVCGARFQRRAATLSYEGTGLELALDKGMLMGGGKERPLCEVEVELKEGDPQAAIAFARELAERFGLQQEEKSKFRRALALARGDSQ